MTPTQIERRTAPWRLRAGVAMIAALALTGCEDGSEFNLFQKRDTAGEGETAAPATSTRLVERDVEAPDVFQVTEAGLWDGRPSLGGVWVAYPDVTDPERVIIRNTANGKFVIGALFRRERESTGPRLQVSSDAASALGMLAGKPNNLNVTALRREEAEVAPEADAAPRDAEAIAAPAAIASATLDPVDTAAAAIDAAPDTPAATPAAAPAAKPAAKPKTSGLSKPFIQIGIFSVEQNANNTAEAMRQDGMVPTVKKQSTSGKAFWRVLVGPAQTSSERAALLKKIKASGFTDAYAVTN